MQNINHNYRFRNHLQTLVDAAGIEVKPLREGRNKVCGFMGESGEYTVGDFVIDDYGHYGNAEEPRHWGIKVAYGRYSFTFAKDENGVVWFHPEPFKTEKDTGWVKTDLKTDD